MKKGRAVVILREVLAAIERWQEFAAEAGVAANVAQKIQADHRNL
jgi:hypothetical protein